MSDAPLILTFDTSAAHCAAALFRGSDQVAARMEPMARGQAERLMPLLEDVLAEGGVRWRDMAALAVLTGPGNFTGIRISVAAARGLAMALGVPAIGVTAFEALGVGLPENGLIGPGAWAALGRAACTRIERRGGRRPGAPRVGRAASSTVLPAPGGCGPPQ